MTTKKLTKLLALYLPYILLGLVATNFGEAWRLAEGKELGDRIMSMMGTFPLAFANPLPSLHPLDLLVGLCCGAGLRLAVYLKSKNAKKYRHGREYGSARWGSAKDIEPFQAPKFEDNILLTKTERLMMNSRPADPKNARNKNVLIVGGSGSGKTRFWIKPNLLQMHSSYVLTDPNGTTILEVGNAFVQKGYRIKVFNTINFKKSMHYNPLAYVHSEKDILKLVTALMTNTKGEGQGGDPFWDKAERLLLVALIAYLHEEAPTEEQNFATLLEMLNTMQVSEEDESYQNPVDLLFEQLDKGSRIPLPDGNIGFTSWQRERPPKASSFPAAHGWPPLTSRSCGRSPPMTSWNWIRWETGKLRCSSLCRIRIPPLISSSAWSTPSCSTCSATRQMTCMAAGFRSMCAA